MLTRPAGQGAALAQRLQAEGASVLLLPLLAIAPTSLQACDLLDNMQSSDWLIFISPNAVRMALDLLPQTSWPPHVQIAAVGKGTARALHAAGCPKVLAPDDGADSESLLRLPDLAQVSGQRVLLMRGEGGRELLAQTLEQRGAQVAHALLYRRIAVPPDIAALQAQSQAQSLTLSLCFVITSSEALQVLFAAAEQAQALDWLRAQCFVFAHPRIAAFAQSLQLNRGIMAQSPEDDAVFAALCRSL